MLEISRTDTFNSSEALKSAEAGWRKAMVLAVESGIPTPTFSSALSYFDGYRSARLPANLLQEPHDYCGAHTCKRLDKNVVSFFIPTGLVMAAKLHLTPMKCEKAGCLLTR